MGLRLSRSHRYVAGVTASRAARVAFTATVAGLILAGIVSLQPRPDQNGTAARPETDAHRLSVMLHEQGTDVATTLILLQGNVVVDPPPPAGFRHVDVSTARRVAATALGGNAVVACKLGILTTRAISDAPYPVEHDVAVWMCVQVAPASDLAGGLPRPVTAVSFVDAVDGHRFFEIREHA